MNTPDSYSTSSKNLLKIIQNNWQNLEDSERSALTRLWNVLTYKWQFQILINLPFLIWWILDKSILKVHTFDQALLNYLNLPEWALSLIGLGQ